MRSEARLEKERAYRRLWMRQPGNRERVNALARKRRAEKPGCDRAITIRYVTSRRALLSQYKDKPCADCGVRYPPYVMDFDHRDPTQKSFDVSQRFRMRLELLLAEVAKCDVVCANCHRERTHRQGFC